MLQDPTEIEFQKLMIDHTDYLLKIAFLYVKDWQAAEDIVQDVFITFYQKSSQYEGRSSIKTYLTKMTINRCKDYLKSWRFRMQVVTTRFTNAFHLERNRVIEQDEKIQLADAVLKLPIKYREVIIHYYFEELLIVDIAQLLNLSENTVKTRLRKARTLLKDELKLYEWEVLLHE